ncbi:tetratricopeptide repeat protein [Candidatus Puniceispirillum marinum]|uniref:Tyrosine protein kinase:Serine/threonine protein kinase:Sel1-like repeat protein n=1 Tax=Puniceispirillum marinum (strain IMCC1322) TaxID=488538 RepID=D5BR25_PUNMI|nr:tetratricopeptide repeat protein [Candidatus Puniceispirillum marinum]ADE38739.1 Tyrosine protein kinase:Serine/threonine protein kinase:Sel1-like repeat protein [Candidatus Puniceispirillum marinum IMCC1322]
MSSLLLAPLLFSPPVMAADLDKGVRAYNAGDYTTALAEFRPLAERGDAAAQNNLGVMFHLGKGVARDHSLAFKWYNLAANQGYDMAQHNLGIMYVYGLGVPKNYVEALRWFRRAAMQGHAAGQYDLGVMYANGEGVSQDDVLAYMWGNLARGQGYEKTDGLFERLEVRMTRKQIATAQAMALKCAVQDYKDCDQL